MFMNEAYEMMLDDMTFWGEEGIYDDDDDIVSCLSDGESDNPPEDDEDVEEVF